MNVILRADADMNIGTGHVFRCLALSQEFIENEWRVTFVTYCKSDMLLQRVRATVPNVIDCGHLGEIKYLEESAQQTKPGWVVLDGYHFGTDYQKAVKDFGFKLLVIDDYAHLEHYDADIILNQNYGAEKYSYSAEPNTKFLLGTEYVLLRREFMKYRDFKRTVPDVATKLLVTLGGADPDNHTLKVLKAVDLLKDALAVKVVLGAGNPHYESIRKEAGGSRHNMEILVGVEDMAPLMAWADAAVSAGGTTVWELAFMGLPALLCIVAKNQEGAVNNLGGDNVFKSLGWLRDSAETVVSDRLGELVSDKRSRKALSERERKIVDGMGSQRISREMGLVRGE